MTEMELVRNFRKADRDLKDAQDNLKKRRMDYNRAKQALLTGEIEYHGGKD